MSPENGTLSVGDHMQVTVEYQSPVVGTHCTDMVLHYSTGQLFCDKCFLILIMSIEIMVLKTVLFFTVL